VEYDLQNISVVYHFKLSVQGFDIDGKIWPDGNAEPANWTIAAYDSSSPLPAGGWQIKAQNKQIYCDLISVYKNNSVTATGLPAGYKIRLTGNNANIGTHTNGTVYLNLEGETYPLDKLEVLDPSSNVADSRSTVFGGDTYNFVRNMFQSIRMDSRRAIKSLQTDLADTKRRVGQKDGAPVDTKRGLNKDAQATGDTLRKSQAQGTADSDAARKIHNTASALADSLNKITNTGAALTDSFKKVQNTSTAHADTKRKSLAQGMANSDTVREVQGIFSSLSDAKRKIQTTDWAAFF